ncbi:hypothetical protein [Roseivivax halodurans]|uniref:hypothetical protein n=1 Tax=Roseivivax halodurans TaxID=93683 RepID=UPI0012F9A249|nr:hypothetical protein [Roseivivax halodurans]
MARSTHSYPTRRRKHHPLDFTGASAMRVPDAAPSRSPLLARLFPLMAAMLIAIALVSFLAP